MSPSALLSLPFSAHVHDQMFRINPNKNIHAWMSVQFSFKSLQKLAQSSGIGLQNCKGLREVRESLCKIAEAYAKFGNRFAENAKHARSSGIGLTDF